MILEQVIYQCVILNSFLPCRTMNRNSKKCRCLRGLHNKQEQGRIHDISRSSSSFLPAEKKRFRRTDQPTDGRTDGHILL